MYQSKNPYKYGTGRRKSSVARVHLFENGTGSITINGRDIDEYFGLETLKMVVRQPLAATEELGKVDIVATVEGGGVSGQAGALRHGVARALLLEAEILILDDALSAVDGRTEHQILHNLRQWGEGRTVIISAHRLSALTEASEILVLQHGHIAQRGRHEALAVQPGWYRDMYRYQQLEAALDEVPQAQEEALDA